MFIYIINGLIQQQFISSEGTFYSPTRVGPQGSCTHRAHYPESLSVLYLRVRSRKCNRHKPKFSISCARDVNDDTQRLMIFWFGLSLH